MASQKTSFLFLKKINFLLAIQQKFSYSYNMTKEQIQNKINEIKAQLREAESMDELANLSLRLKAWESELAKVS